jgi:hypothetical protein
MKIEKEKHFYIKKKVVFLKGTFNIDCNYFINEIEKGIQEEDNLSTKTHVKGQMTSWNYFSKNEKFKEILIDIFDYLNDNDDFELPKVTLTEAWGIKQNKFDHTSFHQHRPSVLSFALYLNDHPQSLIFKDIKEEVKAFPGSFALFSSELMHGCKRSKIEEPKYGIAANLFERLPNWNNN